MGDWSRLPDDILRIMGAKLGVGIDRIRFRSVCRTWRSLLAFPQPPWLLLAEHHPTPSTRDFFGLGRSQQHQGGDGGAGVEGQGGGDGVYKLDLPEIHESRCVGSTGTWLIAIDYNSRRIRILNPFTRRQFNLPPPFTDCFPEKVVLFAPPSSSSCTAMGIHGMIPSHLTFARPGDASWTALEVELPRAHKSFFHDVIFYKNQFYAINTHRMLVVCDLNEAHPKATLIADYRKRFKAHSYQRNYLVEWMGELLLVVKFMHNTKLRGKYPDPKEIFCKLDRAEVYKFDFTHGDWNAVGDLGEYSVFLGLNTSVAVLTANYPGLRKNCIYFTDSHVEVFDLGDGSITPLYRDNTTTSFNLRPLWIVPRSNYLFWKS